MTEIQMESKGICFQKWQNHSSFSSEKFSRTRANAIEGNVEEVVENLRQANIALQGAEDTIHGSGYSLRLIQDRLDEVSHACQATEFLF